MGEQFVRLLHHCFRGRLVTSLTGAVLKAGATEQPGEAGILFPDLGFLGVVRTLGQELGNGGEARVTPALPQSRVVARVQDLSATARTGGRRGGWMEWQRSWCDRLRVCGPARRMGVLGGLPSY